MKEFRFYGERPQWDASLVIKVEELIDVAIGEQGKNVVDFKMLQTVLYILARHLRILEQMVEVRTHGREQAEKDILSKEEADKGHPKQKLKDSMTKSGKKDQTRGGYLSSDESEKSDDGGKGKAEGRSTRRKEEYKIKKSKGQEKEKSGGTEKEVRKERSENWFSDDEGEDSDSGRVKSERDHKTKKYKDEVRDDREERKERSRDREKGDKERRGEEGKAKDDESLKSQKAKIGKDKDHDGVKEDKARDKDGDSVRGGKSEKMKSGDDESKIKSSDKVKKSKDKKSRGTDIEETVEDKAKSSRRASEEGEAIHKDVAEKGGHKGKSKEGDKSGKKSKRRDSRDEREIEGVLSEEREVKGKKGKGGQLYVGSIEVVTQQQFRELERAVGELQSRAFVPAPRMPDNKKLMSDIAQGNASLTDVMQAMQLNARIQATERAIERMAQLVSLLAASGDLPAEVLSTFTELEADVANMADKAQAMGVTKSPKEQGRKSLGLGKLGTLSSLSAAEAEATAAMTRGILGTSGRMASESKETEKEVKEGKEVKKEKKKTQTQALEKGQQTQGFEKGRQTQDIEGGQILFIKERDKDVIEKEKEPSAVVSQIPVSASTSIGHSVHSKRSLGSTGCVTAQEMNEALRALREDLMKNVGNITARANASAEVAVVIAKDVGAKLARAMKLNDRVSTLYGMVNDYTDQLHGFDAGVHSQMQNFQQQLNNIKGDLREGLHELHNISNNAETAAVLELKEQYQVVAAELDDTLHSHKKLLTNQDFLVSEIKDIAECIEELREQKADKDEVIDGLRDKADLNRLAGLLTLEEFTKLYEDLELRIQMCYDKFRSQDAVWMRVVQEFNEVISAKVEMSQMHAMQYEAQEQFQKLNRKALTLKRVLGDPKAAILTRKLTKGAMCAACAQAALIEVSDLATAEPPRLPAFRPRPPGADDVCLREDGPPVAKLTPYEDETRRPHICKRWCGGSHTLLSSAVTRQTAPHFTAGDTGPSRRYMGLGTDNKLYMLVDPCQPCQECNVVEKIPGEIEEPSPHPGSGDQGDGPTVVTGMDPHHITIVADADIQLMRDEMARKRRGLGRRRSSSGALRPLDREGVQEMDSRGHCEDMVSRKASDVEVIMKGNITLGDDDASVRHEQRDRARRSSLAQDRIREQFEAAMPDPPETDFISEAIAALSEL